MSFVGHSISEDDFVYRQVLRWNNSIFASSTTTFLAYVRCAAVLSYTSYVYGRSIQLRRRPNRQQIQRSVPFVDAGIGRLRKCLEFPPKSTRLQYYRRRR